MVRENMKNAYSFLKQRYGKKEAEDDSGIEWSSEEIIQDSSFSHSAVSINDNKEVKEKKLASAVAGNESNRTGPTKFASGINNG